MSNTSKKNLPERDYEVGYGKPPVSSQWKRGQSGNPKGSARAEAVDLLKCVGRALRRRVTIPVDGKPTRMTVLEALANKLTIDAAMGIPSARRELFKLMDFVRRVDDHLEPTVITCELVLEDEDQQKRQLKGLWQDNDSLRQRIAELEAQLEATIGAAASSQRAHPGVIDKAQTGATLTN